FEEYIYLAYGATSESDLLSKYYVQSSLQPYMIYGKLTENDWNILTDYLYDQMAEYYDNYFALDVTHLLVYIDRDEDGSPDDYDEFLDDLSDTVAYEAMLQRLTDAIYAFLNEDDANTMSKLVSTYAKAKHTDPLWGEFKDFGFLVMTEDLSSSSTLTYLNTKDKYDPKFVEGLQAAYVEFGSDEHLSDLTLLYETPVATSFGVHIMLLERGTGFTKPSGKFEMTYDNEGNPKYSEAAVNALDELSLDQLKLYSQYRFYEMVYGTDPDDLEAAGVEMPKIPTSVKTAIEAYFKNIHDSLYVIGALNIVVADSLVEANYLPVADANFTFVASDIALKNIQVRDTYFLQVFGEGDA
ncbi:MAG: hypothetical protein JXB20_06165, partial [Bacilli bacterium]|nr:hypothetical protein [Bacilli bacterium]